MKSRWIAQDIEVDIFQLERIKDSQIVAVSKAELAFRPKMSNQNGDEKQVTGSLTQISINDECIMLFRETINADEKIRDLVLWTF
ncbi:hypothetical protein FRC12_015779 [Ceratobasidium sp. 428]|nr:hypothetical protein FRC12_015779 [Ceratobasidium sp. 428]